MTRALIVAAMLFGGTALASPTAMVHAPAGWTADPEQAAGVARSVAAGKPLADPAATVATEVYAPGGGAKISLVVTRVTSRASGTDRGALVEAAIVDLRGEIQRARLSGGAPAEDHWQQSVTPGARALQGDLSWHDTAAGTRDDARVVAAADPATLVTVTGECVATADAPAPLVAACRAALASLDPGIAEGDRVAIPPPLAAAAAGSAAAAAPTPTATPTAFGSGDGPMLPTARLSDASHIQLPPMAIPQDAPGADRRPVYVGAGVLVLAAAFYWNRRRRERFEPETDREETDDR